MSFKPKPFGCSCFSFSLELSTLIIITSCKSTQHQQSKYPGYNREGYNMKNQITEYPNATSNYKTRQDAKNYCYLVSNRSVQEAWDHCAAGFRSMIVYTRDDINRRYKLNKRFEFRKAAVFAVGYFIPETKTNDVFIKSEMCVGSGVKCHPLI